MQPGESSEIVVLDEQITFYRYEHNLKGEDGKYTTFCVCLAEQGVCPACIATGKDAYFVGFLSVIDLRGYTSSKGENFEWTRKLLPIKIAQQKKFNRLMDRYGSLRGMVLTMTRDGDKDSAIGNDVEFGGEYYEEDDLKAFVRTIKFQDGKQEKEDCSVPYDYATIFPESEDTFEYIEKLTSVGPVMGSSRYEDAELSKPVPRREVTRKAPKDDDWEDQEAEVSDDPPFDVDDKPATRTAAVSTDEVAEDAAEDGDEASEGDDEVKPSSRVMRPVRRSAQEPEKVAPTPVRRPIRR